MTGELTASANCALAVDLGGTKVETAVVSPDGEVVSGTRTRRSTGSAASRGGLIAAIADAVGESTRAIHGELLGVGIGAAGPVDTTSGTTSPLNLPAGAALDVVKIVRGIVPEGPIRLALDGACLVMAEHWLGAARGVRNALAIVVSTGVGGGLLLDGRVITGSSGNAGHIGQIRLREPGGDVLEGTLESIASGPSAVAWARSQGWIGRTGVELGHAYANGDAVARAAVGRSASAVGEAIASTAALLDLDIAILAGGFINVTDDYVDQVRESARRHAPLPHARRVDVVRSPLGDAAPLIGAASLIHFPLGA
ncbi:MAG: sugar kinase [Nocardioides sp.]|nr:sugar kinase [Nocardioides sp.]